MLRAHLLVDELQERFAACAARRTLCHGRARGVEAAERQRVDLTEQVSGRPRDELLLQFLVAHLARVAAGSILEAERPAIEVLALAAVVGAERELRVHGLALPP